MNVSHNVASQHVKNLEDWLSADLFSRYGNRVELTATGRTLMPQVASRLQTLAGACKGMLRKSQSGAVVVSAEPAFASLRLRKHIRIGPTRQVGLCLCSF